MKKECAYWIDCNRYCSPVRNNPPCRVYHHRSPSTSTATCSHRGNRCNRSAQQKLVIATTTSLYDTGLLNYLQPKFESQYNVKLAITSQGTGKAIQIATNGDADVLLVHSPAAELAFMQTGKGLNRRSFASNYFIIVGPPTDPAGINNMTPENAFTTLLLKGTNKTANVYFVSRGDGSGTQTAEINIWKKAGYNYTTQVEKSGLWYIEAGKGMGETLQMASDKGAYTLTDEGTYPRIQGQPDPRASGHERCKPAQHLQRHGRVQ